MNQPFVRDEDDNQFAVPVVPNTLAVYRNLRIGLGVTALMILTAIFIQSTYVMNRDANKFCWQEVLSGYFYTSAHSVFVAGLLGLGTMLFVYRGSCDTENALLQLAGVAAITAALVPIGKEFVQLCTPPSMTIPDDVAVVPAIRSNMWAVVAALALAWAITWFQRYHDRKDDNDVTIRQQNSPGGNFVRCFLRLVVVIGLIALCAYRVDLPTRNAAHAVAGLLLLSSFIATVWVTAFIASRETGSPRSPALWCIFKGFYWVWAVIMLLTLVVIVVLIFSSKLFGEHGGFVLEAAILGEFCVYWVVQTFDLWDDPDRRYRLTADDRNRLAPTSQPERIIPTDGSTGDRIMSFL